MTQQAQTMMHAAAIDQFGGQITPHTLPVPMAGPDEILIRIQSAGIGVWDPFEQQGYFAKMMGSTPRFPYVLGSEGAGTVAAVGSKVSGFKKGDRVYAMALANPKGGFYAEYVAVPANNASAIPGGLTIEQAGVMPVDAITALVGLEKLGLKAGERILILGASGGIGHLAVQLAQRMGARVLAVASGSDGVALVKKLGAEAVIDGHQDDIAAAARNFAHGGMDCALLATGGKPAQEAMQVLRNGGRAAYPNGVEPAPAAPAGTTIQAYDYDGIPTSAAIATLNKLIGHGPFVVHVAKAFPLDQAGNAHQALHQHYLGKMALRPA